MLRLSRRDQNQRRARSCQNHSLALGDHRGDAAGKSGHRSSKAASARRCASIAAKTGSSISLFPRLFSSNKRAAEAALIQKPQPRRARPGLKLGSFAVLPSGASTFRLNAQPLSNEKPRPALDLTGALTLSNKRKLPSFLATDTGVTFGASQTSGPPCSYAFTQRRRGSAAIPEG